MYVCCNGEGRREEREGACGWLSNFAAWHIQSASSFLTCWPFCRWPFCCGPVVGSVYLGAFCFLPLPALRLFVQTEICKFVKHFLMCLILFQFFSFSCSIFVSVCKGCVCVFVYTGTSFGTWTCVAGETLSLSLYITSGFIGQQGLTQLTAKATTTQVTQLVPQWASIKYSPHSPLLFRLPHSAPCFRLSIVSLCA